MAMNTVLIGYRCCGKSSVGKVLADIMSCDFVDTDKVVEHRYKATVSKIVADKGWEFFRQAETAVLKEVMSKKNQVIATGGGIVLAEENQALITDSGCAVWLFADVKTIVKRLAADMQNKASRPRFTSKSLFIETRNTLAQRLPVYEKLACMRFDTTAHPPKDIAWMIKRRIDHVRI
ncbi:MAG TPA: shikimate kinase [Desulfotignum sp.]|nr:shikimate kinase [Desulfotignum sp.]